MNSKIDFELIHNNPSNKAVLLFHGLTGSPFEMKKYGNFLFKNDFDVFCYSLPGHGEKQEEIQNVSWQDWCACAQEQYSRLRGKYKYFFVSGLCLGAVISIYLAQNNSDITGVMALSTTLFLDGKSMPKFKFLMPLGLKTILRYYYTFPEDDCLGIKNENTRKTLAKIMAKSTEKTMDNYPLSCVAELLSLSAHTRANLKKVSCPIILIHSKLDNLASTKSAEIVFKKISSKEKKYIELSNSYHMVLYDNEKMYAMESVLNFTNEILTKNNEQKILEFA